MTALTWATHQGHEKVVDVLLKAGANPDIQLHVSVFMPILSNPIMYDLAGRRYCTFEGHHTWPEEYFKGTSALQS